MEPDSVCPPVTEKELKRLRRRFKRLDTDQSGTLTLNEFQAIPGLENNPLVSRVMDVFDRDHSGAVDCTASRSVVIRLLDSLI